MIEKATDKPSGTALRRTLPKPRARLCALKKCSRCTASKPRASIALPLTVSSTKPSEVAGDVDDKSVLDAALIAAAQAVEHYEITRYGTLIAWANMLGRSDWPPSCSRTSMRKRRRTVS